MSFISTAYADTAAGAASATQASAANGGYSLTIMLAVFMLFAYFLILRPQSKRAKETQNLLNSLKPGDEVLTAGGLVGRITKMSDQYIAVCASDQIEFLMQRSAVVSLLPKGSMKSLLENTQTSEAATARTKNNRGTKT